MGRPVVSHLGFAFETWYDVALALLILALPARWPDRGGRLVVGTLAVAFAIRSVGRLLFLDPGVDPVCGCPINPFAVFPSQVAYEMVEIWAGVVIATTTLVVAAIAIRRLVRGSPAVRRVMWPMLVAGAVAMIAAALAAADSAMWIATGAPLIAPRTIPAPSSLGQGSLLAC